MNEALYVAGLLLLVLLTIIAGIWRWRRDQRTEGGPARVRHCPGCGYSGVFTESGWLVHRDLCQRQLT